MKLRIFLTLTLLIATPLHPKVAHPKITIVLIVDQLSYRYMSKIKPYCSGGIRTLLDEGINFENAYFPHGMPATATGHATLSTGALAKDHGFIGNRWYDEQGKDVYCDGDDVAVAAVFNPHGGEYEYGKSPKNLMVDSLSDQCILNQDPDHPFEVFALSLKGRAAVACASKLGKAIWFDYESGQFTTSKAYYPSIPQWLATFNTDHDIHQHPTYTWHLFHPYNQAAYRFANPNTYQFTHSHSPLVNRQIKVDQQNPGGYKGDYKHSIFAQMPQANQLLLDLAQTCIDTHLQKDDNKHMLLWVSLSSLDKLGHDYGPDSKESYDMLYHLDHQLDIFMKKVQKEFGKERVLFALTADHGVSPIIELMEQIGFSNARRFHTPDMIAHMNAFIEKKYGLEKVVRSFKSPQFYLNNTILNEQSAEQRNAIIQDIISFLHQQPAIKNVWTFNELLNSTYRYDQPENFLKEQLYAGRSGEITIQTHPYAMVTKWRTGTDHRSPYEYTLHVPLIFYQPDHFEHKNVYEKVWMPQVAPTLAHMMGTHKPSASSGNLLPGIVS